MIKKAVVLVLCLIFFFTAFSQKKIWKSIVYTTTGKEKGVLKEVTDSSAVIQMKRGVNSILFSNISGFKFIRTDDESSERVLGALSGAAAGAAITSSLLTKNKTGEPRAMGGVVGGIGGGLLGAIVGALSGPALHNLLSAKRIKMIHSRTFYLSLPRLLQTYLVK